MSSINLQTSKSLINLLTSVLTGIPKWAISQLCTDIHIVSARLRGAFLVDIVFLDEIISTALAEAFQDSEAYTHLRVIQLSPEHLFIVNVETVLPIEEITDLEDENIAIIDVTAKDGCPKDIPCPKDFNFDYIRDQIFKGNPRRLISINLPDTWIIPFTGFLLEYQVIYYMDDPRSDINALANIDLQVIKVILSNEETVHQVMSFSFPENMFPPDEIRQIVEVHWKTRLRDTFSQWVNVSVHSDYVNLSRVIL